MNRFFEFVADNREKMLELSLEHLKLTLISLLLACVIAIPIGIWMVGRKRIANAFLGIASLLQTVPSIALLGSLIPLFGIGVKPAILALLLYAILPILQNTYTGIQGVSPAVREAAAGMGMTRTQVLRSVTLPLALPVIMAGVRTAAVINVGVATLASYIGAGGLGEFIFGGIALNNNNMILAGAVPAALMALLFDQLLGRLQKIKFRASLAVILLPLLVSLAWRGPAQQGQLSAAFDPEFADRADGLPSIQSSYPGLEFNTLILNAGLLYRAVEQGEVDLISGYSTDGRVQAYNLKILEDDQHAFPPYHCAAVVNGQTAKDHPELVETLNLLGDRINDSLMTSLNYQVDHLQRSPEEVAKAFLLQAKLWKSPAEKADARIITIGSKLFSEQYILVEIFKQLIEGYTDLQVDPKPGLGGTKICYDALREGEIDIYPEYTGTGFQVLLEPSDSLRAAIFTDASAVYEYVKHSCAERDQVQWLEPLGFNNTYALMCRQDQAQKKGWNSIGDLRKNEEE
ncbi:MAG: ABC transporter permease/substrate-binding protein [Bacteroidota bacterium]